MKFNGPASFLLLTAFLSANSSFAKPSPQTLTVYTYDAFQSKWGPGPKLKAIFESECHCVLKFVAAADGGALLSRLKIEGKQTKADVVVGLDSTMTKDAKATDLFAPLTSSSKWNLPAPIEDLDTFQPVDYGWYAFMYDSKAFLPESKLKMTLPGSFAQLLKEPSLKRQIIIQDPRSSSVGLGLLLWIHAEFGDKYLEPLKDLHNQTMLVGHGWSDSYGKFTKGEAPFVMSYTTSEAYHREDEKTERFRALHLTDGHYLQVEVAGVMRTSKNSELAKQFLSFIATPKAQALIAHANWMYPVIDIPAGLPKSYALIPKPAKTLYIPASIVALNRKHWTDEWVQIFTGK